MVLKSKKFYLSLIMIIFVVGFTPLDSKHPPAKAKRRAGLTGFIFIDLAKAEEGKESEVVTQKGSKGIRIIISTSGSAKFRSYWLDNPDRLVVEFRSQNILSKLDNEVPVNQGVIERITSSYFRSGKKRTLKSLTFELTQRVPYKIWQEGNAIILNIQPPLRTDSSSEGGPLKTSVLGEENKEIFAIGESREVILGRLGAMDAALTQVQKVESQLPLEVPQPNLSQKAEFKLPPKAEPLLTPKTEERMDKTEIKLLSPIDKLLLELDFLKIREKIIGKVFWVVSLTLISSLGFLVWHRRRVDKKLKKLESELQEKDRRLEQEEILREEIQKTSLLKEEEHKKLKNSFKSLKEEFAKEEAIKDESSSEEREEPKSFEGPLGKETFSPLSLSYEQLKNSFESLKEGFAKNEEVKEKLSSEEKEISRVQEKFQERRLFPRLTLSRDFDQTIIARIELPNTLQKMRCFVENISTGGLCFETKKQFKEKEPINLKLFFYGDQVPMLRIRGQIVWKKAIGAINRYGISFESLTEKDKLRLNRYIESKIRES